MEIDHFQLNFAEWIRPVNHRMTSNPTITNEKISLETIFKNAFINIGR